METDMVAEIVSDSSDDELDDMADFTKPAFDMSGMNTDDVDDNKPCTSGFEYLCVVRKQAKTLPKVVTVDSSDPKRIESRNARYNYLVQSVALPPAPTGMESSAEWCREQIAAFASLRWRFARILAANPNLPRTHKLPPKPQNSIPYFLACGDDGEPLNTPRMSTLLRIRGVHAQLLLVELTHHIELTPLRDHNVAQWLYGLLLLIEKPVREEVSSYLRTLARICASTRQNLKADNEEDVEICRALNLIIIVVVHYFEQRDLLPDDDPILLDEAFEMDETL